MIKIVYGSKGSGKSAKLVSMANAQSREAKGIVCFVDKSNNRMHDLDHSVRLVNAGDMKINGVEKFYAFIGGMVAGNYDIETIYLDSIESLTGLRKGDLVPVFERLLDLTKVLRVNFVAAVDGEKDELPEFLLNFAQE